MKGYCDRCGCDMPDNYAIFNITGADILKWGPLEEHYDFCPNCFLDFLDWLFEKKEQREALWKERWANDCEIKEKS